MVKCLVLGANGLLGSVIVRDLSVNHQVIAFDRYSEDKVNFHLNENISVFKGDFMNIKDLSLSLKGVDYVFHFISTSNPIVSEDNPLLDIETNILMSVKLFELCVKHKVKRVIYPSSGGAIYGVNKNSESKSSYSENDLTLPISPYAIGKLTIENYLRYFKNKHQLDYVVYRISNPYGSNQPKTTQQGVIPIFIEKILSNQTLTVYGDGSMIRDYIHVDDVSRMIMKSFEKEHKQDVYNIGSGCGTSIKDIINTIEIISKKKASVKYTVKPSSFVERVVLDTSRFKNEFNLKPSIKLTEGIAGLINEKQ